MHEAIAHCSHQSPRDLRILFLYMLRDLIRGLADDYQVKFDGSYRFCVCFEIAEIHSLGECFDFHNCVQDVTDSALPVFTRHGRTLP